MRRAALLVLLMLMLSFVPLGNSLVESSVYYVDVEQGKYYAVNVGSKTFRVFYIDANGDIVYVTAYRWDLNNSYIIFQAPCNCRIYLREEVLSYTVLNTKDWFSIEYPSLSVHIETADTWNDTKSLDASSMTLVSENTVYNGDNVVLSREYSVTVMFEKNDPYDLGVEVVDNNTTIYISYSVNSNYDVSLVDVQQLVHLSTGYSVAAPVSDGTSRQIDSITWNTTHIKIVIDGITYWSTYNNTLKLEFTLSKTKEYAKTNNEITADNGNVIIVYDSLDQLAYSSIYTTSTSYTYYLYSRKFNITLWTATDVSLPLLIPIDTSNAENIISNPNFVVRIPVLGISSPAQIINYGSKNSFLVIYNPRINPANVTTLELNNIKIENGTIIAPHIWEWYLDGIDDYIIYNHTYTIRDYFEVEVRAKVLDTNIRNIFSTRLKYVSGDYSFDFKFKNGELIHGDIGNGTAWITIAADASYLYQTNVFYTIKYIVTPTSYEIYINNNMVGNGSYSANSPLLTDSSHQPVVGASVPLSGAINTFYGYMSYTKITINNTIKMVLDPTFFNGSHYFDLLNSSIVGVPYGGVKRVVSEEKWLWVVYNATDDDRVHLKWFPRGSVVEFYDLDGDLVASVTVEDSDEVVSIAPGNYTVKAMIPLSSLEFEGDIIYNYPYQLTFPELQYRYGELGEVLSMFPISGTAEIKSNETTGYTWIQVNGSMFLGGYVGSTIVLDLSGNYTLHGVSYGTIASTDRSWTILYVYSTDARIDGEFNLTTALVLYNTRVFTNYFMEYIDEEPQLREYSLSDIVIVQGGITGSWNYRIPLYITLSELPLRLDDTGYVFRLELPVSDWIKAGLLSPALEDLLIVDSNMQPLPFYYLRTTDDGKGVVYVKYDKPILSTTIVLYVLLQNKQLWGTGSTFSTMAVFDEINPREFTDDFAFDVTYTYLTYNLWVLLPESDDFGFKAGKTWYDFVAYNSSNNMVYEQHGSIITKNATVPEPESIDEIVVYINKDYNSILVYSGSKPWFSIDLDNDFPDTIPVYYIGYRNCKVYAARSLLYSYSIGQLQGGLERPPTITIVAPSTTTPVRSNSVDPLNMLYLILMLVALLAVGLVVKWINESDVKPRHSGMLPW